MQEPHRSGSLKQNNKRHKTGKHRSKGEVNAQFKGKHAVKHLSHRKKIIQSRNERRHQANQLRLRKKEEVLDKKRLIGSDTTPPFVVAIIPLGLSPSPEKLLDLIIGVDLDSSVSCSQRNIFHINIKKWKQRFSFLIPPTGDLYATLDAVKVCDSVIFLLSAGNSDIIDDASEKLLTCLLTQGLPSTSVVVDMESILPQKKHSFKQEVQKVLNRWLPNEKITTVENNGDAVALLRKLGNQKQRINFQRQIRPYLLVEELEVENSNESEFCTLKASGYLRGQALSANNLIHLTGWGDFQMLRIDSLPDPRACQKNPMENVEVLQIADPGKQLSLQSVNVPDPMDAEQTWPTEEEIINSKQVYKNVIKGTSNYQACWIPEDKGFDGEENVEVNLEEDIDMEAESEGESGHWEECGDDAAPHDEAEPEKYDKTVNFNEEVECLNKMQAARDEYAFPDEVDTPKDIPARERFSKYRGLASFRTSPWDPKENLPQEYGRIFQFENFDRSRRKIINSIEEQMDGIPPGGYLTIHIKNFPSKEVTTIKNATPLVICGLLPHENKMSVINFVVKRNNHSCFYQHPMKSKDTVIVHCGFRRYRSRPIYSHHTNGSKHKYERFFHPDSTVVATVYAPITYPPSPVLLFTESGKGLLATGRVLSVNPDRLIIKRVILSGHPFRVLKHSAIIRFMFFNREDILWFKPVELRTKHGRRGHIKEPLGTHGHMKAVFDDQLKSQDTVLIDLYKRVYPPWFYETDNLQNSPLYNFISLVPELSKNNDMEV